MSSSVDPSVLPASSMLSVLAPAHEDNSSLDLTSMTSLSMSLTFVCPDEHITCINDQLSYADPYAQALSYSDDTPMDDALSS
jgi:hypothetical protein